MPPKRRQLNVPGPQPQAAQQVQAAQRVQPGRRQNLLIAIIIGETIVLIILIFYMVALVKTNVILNKKMDKIGEQTLTSVIKAAKGWSLKLLTSLGVELVEE
jgi:hypothetical protein